MFRVASFRPNAELLRRVRLFYIVVLFDIVIYV
jgi:hypothetical protein